jgi:hypothetical protein
MFRKALIALSGALLLAFAPGSQSIEPDPTARAMIKGWYSLKASSAAGDETIEACLLRPLPRLLRVIDDFDGCRTAAITDDGEKFDLMLECPLDDESSPFKVHIEGVSRPGLLNLHVSYPGLAVGDLDDEDVTRLELKRLRDCSKNEESAASAIEARTRVH